MILAAYRRMVVFMFAAVMAAAVMPAFADYPVMGRFYYEDRSFGLEGFTGTASSRPIRLAEVRILTGATTIASGRTDSSGFFSLVVPGTTAQPITAICLTTSNSLPGLLVDVRVATDSLGFGDYYAVASSTVNANGTGIVDFGLVTAPWDSDAGAAFNIWDVASDAIQFVSADEVAGRAPGSRLTLIWNRRLTRTGSFYTGEGTNKYIYVGSTAAWDDTVISHEFGHFMDDLYSKSDSPGGSHFIGDDNQDMRLSWAEGLATFLGSSIRRFKRYGKPDIYVSTDGVRLNFSYDLETLAQGRATIASKTGSANELAVTASLWDMTDGPSTEDASPGSDDDRLERPFSEVWKVLTRYFPAVSRPGITVETFWDGWFSPLIAGGSLPEMEEIFAGLNGIEFLADPDESDDTPFSATPLPQAPQPHLLAGAHVRLSELQLGSADAIELYNAGDVEADIDGWTVEATATGYSSTVFEIQRFKLAPGAFVLLSELGGASTKSVLYFNDNISWANGEDGACALRDASGRGVDFVRWGKSTESVPVGTLFQGPNPPSPPAGRTLARNYAGTDTDTALDWSAQTATGGTYNLSGYERHHTFYPDGDEDYCWFTPAAGHTYLLETLNLANAADTVLDLLGADGSSVITQNDDYGPGKSSRVVWTAPDTGRHYVRIRRFGGSTNVARYGSYDLRIIDSGDGVGAAAPQKITVSRPGQGGSYQRLSEAVLAAANGDTIEILDSGVYSESITISGKSLVLRAAPGQSPVIDGRSNSSSATVNVNTGKTVTIEGLTVMAGPRGIRIGSGIVTIRNTIVFGATDDLGFSDGIQVVGPSASLTLLNSTVVDNRRLGLGVFQSASARVVNSIIRGNGETDIDGDGTATVLSISNSLIGSGDWAGKNGNIAGDPLFANPPAGNYRLTSGSPCIDRGSLDPALAADDADGIPRSLDGDGDGAALPDLGAFEYLPPSLLGSSVVFPQIAAGGNAPEYRTTIVALNPSAVAAAASVSLVRSDATPFAVEPLRRGGSEFNMPVQPGGLAKIDAQMRGEIASGYARILSSVPLSGTALFQAIRDGRILSEAGVGLSKPSRRTIVYIDNQERALSGYAIANANENPALITMTLRDRAGALLEVRSLTLGANRHVAEFAFQRFAAAGSGFEGSIEIESDQAVASVALRYDNPSADVFSTIPVLADAGEAELYFPQVADGGGYRTNFILVNPSAAPVSARFEFFASDGNPLPLSVAGEPRTDWVVPLLPNGVSRFVTDGASGTMSVGWVRVTASSPIGGSAMFQTVTGVRIDSEAGVSHSLSGTHFLSEVESIGYTESGLAISNPNSFASVVRLNLRNAAGLVVATTGFSLPPRGHVARFFTQWFPTGFEEFEGTIEITATAPVAAVALRYDNPFADVFASLPVVPVP